MLPRKQRILLMVLIPVFLVLILVLVFLMMFLKTDFMKSNDTLFKKYFTQNFSSISALTNFEEFNSYNNILETSNYETSSNITLSNSQTEGNLSIIIDGKKDNTNDIEYNNIQLKSGEEKLIQLEYLKQNDLYGIKFSDLFKQYISIRNENLKELLLKIGMTEEQLQNVPDSIQLQNDLFKNIQLTDEEKDELTSKYINIILNNISSEKYSKQKNALITVDNVSMNTNAYKITITKEEYNNIIINILETILEDDIILNKLEILQNSISNLGTSTINIKQYIIDLLETEIKKIKDNNIGTEETSITVYQYKGNLVRTTIEDESRRTIIDRITNEETEKIIIQNTEISEEENNKKIEISKNTSNNNIQINIGITKEENDLSQNINFSINNSKVDNTINKEASVSFNNEINLQYKNIINIKDNQEIDNLNENNNIVLNDLEQDKIQRLIGIIKEKLNPSMVNIASKVAQQIPMLSSNSQNTNNISNESENSVTELQRNRFNSQIEIYAGDEVTNDTVKEMINAISGNLGGIEVVNKNVLNIKIEKGKQNSELAERISKVISDGESYKVEMKYDNTTGLINTIVLTKIIKE